MASRVTVIWSPPSFATMTVLRLRLKMDLSRQIRHPSAVTSTNASTAM